MAADLEIRRMNYVSASPEDRATIRRIITAALDSCDAAGRPELAAEFAETLAMFDEVDAGG